MDILKTPHQKLLEEAGAVPASPGMVHTPKQMLMQESGIMPRFAPGGKVAKGALSLLQKQANKAKYLKDTKVVDYNGKPITMYHHTTDFQGDAFDPKLVQQKDQGYHGQGMYFGADDYLKRSAFGKNSTGNVAGQEGFEEGSQVMPVNLSIKNPKYIDVADQSLYGVPSEELKKQGYDGVIVTRDDSFKNAMGRVVPRQKVYNAVAFEPTQVKSAIGNEGTFDPLDPRLSKAEGGHISAEDMLAELIYRGQAPQHFAEGGRAERMSPEFQALLDKLYSQQIYSGELPPEPTFQAQPVTLTSRARDAAASLIGDLPADRLFGTGSEGQKIEYLPLQFLNPISAITETISAVPETARQLHQGDLMGAGFTAGATGLGVLPFLKPIKSAIKKLKPKK